ncbi:MAG: hypothetical protein EPO07_16420 [Verrucomicrobia bacterium]|nr:MAG: hypothetical protein EPO07_16420 [Verrucomicrobiota bacterium]
MFLFGCSDPQPGKVKVVSDIPYSKDFVLQRGEWCGLKLPNQKVIYFSCIKDDKPQLVPYSTTGDRTYYGSFPWAEDQAGDYIKAGESKVIGGLSPTRREYTLFIGEFRLDVIEDHTAHGGLPVEVKITK